MGGFGGHSLMKGLCAELWVNKKGWWMTQGLVTVGNSTYWGREARGWELCSRTQWELQVWGRSRWTGAVAEEEAQQGINGTAFLCPSTGTFLLILPFEKSSFTCTGFQPCSASWGEVLDSEHFFSKRWGAHTACVLWGDRFLFQSCPQLSVSQIPGMVWAKEGKGAPGQFPLVSRHPPAPWNWCTQLGWSWSFSAPSLGKKCYSIQCLSIVVGFETLVPRYTGQRCLESFSVIGS